MDRVATRENLSNAAPCRDCPARPSRVTAMSGWMLAGVLLACNVATLISEAIHETAFSALASVVGFAGKAAAEAVLSRSPVQAKVRAAEKATRLMQAQNAELQARHSKMLAEHEATKASRAALVKEHDALRAVTAKRASAVKAFATRTTVTLSSRAASAITTFPARAAPYVGIAALVGFTTVELKSDCELARALVELNAQHGNDSIDTDPVCRAIEMVPSPQQAWAAVKLQASSTLRSTYDALEHGANRAWPSPSPARTR